MKKFSLLTLALIGFSVASVFTSCSEEEAKPKPTIAVEKPTDGAEVNSGSIYDIKFTASADAELQTVTVKVTNGGNSFTLLDSTFAKGTSTFSYNQPFIAGAAGTEVITITVSDRDNTIETRTITLTVKSGLTETTGAFFHISGKYAGAYDLVNAKEMKSSDADADKDMQNTDAAGATFTGSWKTGTGNTSLFVKSNNFNYASATAASIEAAYNAGVATGVVANPATGDIYVAKLRTGAYCAIKIVSVDPNFEDPNNTTANKGKITFDFKK